MRINHRMIIHEGDLRSRNRRQGGFLSGRQCRIPLDIIVRGRPHKLLVDVSKRPRQRQRRVRRPAKIKRTLINRKRDLHHIRRINIRNPDTRDAEPDILVSRRSR